MGHVLLQSADAVRFGDLVFRTIAAQTFAGRLSLFEVQLAPGRLSGPLHVHAREDAISYVLDGCLTFQVGDDVVDAPAGSAVLQPRGIRHTFWNSGDRPARSLDVVMPGGLEQFYEDVAAAIAGQPDAIARVASMNERFGITMDWESVTSLAARFDVTPAAR